MSKPAKRKAAFAAHMEAMFKPIGGLFNDTRQHMRAQVRRAERRTKQSIKRNKP